MNLKTWSGNTGISCISQATFLSAPLKRNGWNLKKHPLKRKIIWTKPPWLWVPAVAFRGCNYRSRWIHCSLSDGIHPEAWKEDPLFPMQQIPICTQLFRANEKKLKPTKHGITKILKVRMLGWVSIRNSSGLQRPFSEKFLFKNSIFSRNRRGACNQWTRLLASLALPAP